jgi:hypothetical protein
MPVTSPPPSAYIRGTAWNNTTVPAPATGLLPPGPACQPCPDCGGLECLCRPRFFAGQLLTEQDLNRLDQYIIAKNRLHNRYLVGHGVVCGLEVQCSPCANTVSVSAGYAIDPCGSDIIVCSPDTVDICKLINACTPTNQVDCGPYKDASYCRDVAQEWILAIRYEEAPSRGVTPLTGAAQCSCGSSGSRFCSCGAGATKTCGCGSMLPAGSCCGQTMTNAAPVSTNRPRRGAPPACEPTVTCETYRYEVFPAPQQTTDPLFGGNMAARLTCCIETVFADFPALPTILDPGQLSAFCCNTRQWLIRYLMGHGGTDCEAIAKLRTVNCPGPNDPNFWAEIGTAFTDEGIILFEILLGCFCSVALPPCPPPGDPRVPLASVRIRASDCTILSVCDWTLLRKHVVTTRTLGYWFGWLPFEPIIRNFMQQACCAVFDLPDQVGTFAPTSGIAGLPTSFAREAVDRAAPQAAASSGAASSGTASSGTASSGATPAGTAGAGPAAFLTQPISFGTRTYRASNPITEAVVANLASGSQPLAMGDLMHAMLDPINPGTAETLKATPRAKVLAEIARPLLSAFGPLLSAATGGLGQQAATTDTNAAAMTAMQAELDALKTTVTAQQAALDRMQQSPPPTKQS